MAKSTGELENELKTIQTSKQLETWISKNEIGQERFCDYLDQLFKEKKVNVTELSGKIAFNRSYIYALRNGTKNPTRKTIIKIAIGIEASLDELNRLLKLSGTKELYAKKEEDAVIAFGIQNHWNICQIEELLEKRGLPMLL